MDVETLHRQKFFNVNISFGKEKKQERENSIIDKIKEKLPPDNDNLYIKYNPEENSYQSLTDDELKKKRRSINTINKKILKIEDKNLKKKTKQKKTN